MQIINYSKGARLLFRKYLIMKLIIVVLTTACLQLSARGYSQNVELSGKNMSFEKVFSSIERQTGYTFFYKVKDLKGALPISVNLKQSTLQQALAQCFKGQPLNYVIENKTIVVTKKNMPADMPQIAGQEKSIIVTGKVLDDAGTALIGVTVTVKGTRTATQTNVDGKFKLTVDDNATLVFTYIGYTTVEEPVKGRTAFNVTLRSNAKDLDQIVVIGYGTAKKSDLTGSVSGINSADLNRNKTTDVLSAMQGKVAGVDIASQSGELGAGLNITVRGGSSIYGTSTPLFVIDGIPIDVNPNEAASSSVPSSTTSNPLANINPADIQSIEILKDASATAIYGSRGANGVVLVTTKTGKAGDPRIDYDGYVSFGSLSKKLDVLSADDFIKYQQTIYPTGLLASPGPDANGLYPLRDYTNVPKHDWQSEIYQTSISQSHNLTVSGGNNTTTFSGGVGYLHDEGLIRANTNDRYTLRLRVDHQATDRLKVGINISNSYSTLNGATNSGSNFYNNVVDKSIPTYFITLIAV